MISIKTKESDLAGSTVLLRASLNVPLRHGEVRNTYRIDMAGETIEYLLKRGAKVVVVAHIGREPSSSLKPVFEFMKDRFVISWGGDITDQPYASAVRAMEGGTALMFENLRKYEAEYKNDVQFAEHLMEPVDFYVNDAFAASHREHASLLAAARLRPAFAGLRLEEEVKQLKKAMEPEPSSLFILGGAKFDTKLDLIEQYQAVYDTVFVGGALLHDVMRARNLEIGRSLVSDLPVEKYSALKNLKIITPTDVVVERADGTKANKSITAVSPEDTIYDSGPETNAYLAQLVSRSQTVLWNGPLGNYEAGYTEGTQSLAQSLADSDVTSYVGGGDTVAAISALSRLEDFSFVSTGGGAMLTFLERGTLPTLELLQG